MVPREYNSRPLEFILGGGSFLLYFTFNESRGGDIMNIFIGGAWPYANGSLHLGHIAGLLAGDIIARYHRLKGNNVLYVSGSDCHGTPIAIRAKSEGVSPKEITDKYHKEFVQCFEKLGFSYDLYSRTDQPFHHNVVKEVILELYDKGFIFEKEVEQFYCDHCTQFLSDRFLEGSCPNCNNVARGDQCDYCSNLLEPTDLIDIKCKLCQNTPLLRETTHLYFKLSAFQRELEEYLANSNWRENASNLTKRYLDEKLQDRAISRDVSWGVDLPIEGYENKKVYVWIEAVIGYLSASKQLSEESCVNWEDFWKDDSFSYYIHGKDNIPFHTVILPAILKVLGLHPPDKIISSEYLTIEGEKLSTSRNWAVWVPDILQRYHPDSIRYFLTINGPEKRDSDFSWREFINRHNGELLGAYGNLVNRTLVFVQKFYEGAIPKGQLDIEIERRTKELFKEVGELIEKGELKQALEKIFVHVRFGNKYFDDRAPWIDVKENKDECDTTIFNCVQLIANLSILLEPFLPFSSKKVQETLNLEDNYWGYYEIKALDKINTPEVLFDRVDKKQISIETEKLESQRS